MKAPELLTIKEAAKILKCSGENVRRLCCEGKIQATQEFGDWRISKPALERQIIRALNAQAPLVRGRSK